MKTPKHAYSPWNEEKVEYKFPPGGDKFVPGRVLIKIGPKVQITQPERQGAWTSEKELNKLL